MAGSMDRVPIPLTRLSDPRSLLLTMRVGATRSVASRERGNGLPARHGRTATVFAWRCRRPRVEWARLARRFEAGSAQDVVEWAVERFGHGLSLVCSFQNCVLIDLVTRVDPKVDVVFLDTGAHFPETMTYVERIETQYELKLRIVTPGSDADEWPCGSARCCELRKTAPLARALKGQEAWMTGLKRVDSATAPRHPDRGVGRGTGARENQPHRHVDP